MCTQPWSSRPSRNLPCITREMKQCREELGVRLLPKCHDWLTTSTLQSRPVLKESPQRQSRRHEVFSRVSAQSFMAFPAADHGSVMERAIGHTKAPHPELEAELQQEYAKIVPKVERGVVTRTESENQDNGNTEGVGANDMSRPSLARRELLSSVLGTVRHRTNGCTSTSYKDSTHDTLPEPRPVHITTRKAHNDEGPVYVFRPKEQSSSEQSGRKSPKLSTRRCQSFGETANRTAGRDSDVISRAYRCEDTRTVA